MSEDQNEVEAGNVKMEDGTIVNFGKRARFLSEEVVNENGFSLRLLVASGKVLTYKYEKAGIGEFLAKIASFGASSKVKAAIASCKTVEEIETCVKSKVEEFNGEVFTTNRAGSSLAKLTIPQMAYAVVNNVDPEDAVKVGQIKDLFKAWTKEELLAFKKRLDVRKVILQLNLDAAQAANDAFAKVEGETS